MNGAHSTAKPGGSWRRASRLWALGALLGCASPQYAFKDGEAIGEPSGLDAATQGQSDAAPPVASLDGATTSPDAGLLGQPRDGELPSALRDADTVSADTVRHDAALLAPDAALAEAAPTVALPAWAEPLIGRYAFRTHGVSRDALGIASTGDELWLGEIARTETGLELRADTCQSIVTSEVLQIQLEEPSALTTQRRRVVLGDGVWSTEGLPQYDGYSREVPAGCVDHPGEVMPRPPPQGALGPTCVCPASADAKPTADDCRVTDPDDDRRPGLTVNLRGQIAGLPGVLDARAHVAIESRTHFIGGRVDAKGAHSATLVVDAPVSQLSCEPAGCGTITGLQTICADQAQTAELAPLLPSSGAWDCARVRAEFGVLFPGAVAGVPASCAP
jgi:hypothetical protein